MVFVVEKSLSDYEWKQVWQLMQLQGKSNW